MWIEAHMTFCFNFMDFVAIFGTRDIDENEPFHVYGEWVLHTCDNAYVTYSAGR